MWSIHILARSFFPSHALAAVVRQAASVVSVSRCMFYVLIHHCAARQKTLTDFSVLGVSVELSDEGVQQVDEVVACVFSYIGSHPLCALHYSIYVSLKRGFSIHVNINFSHIVCTSASISIWQAWYHVRVPRSGLFKSWRIKWTWTFASSIRLSLQITWPA